MSELLTQISNNFHFLRPELLWLSLPLLALAIMLFRQTGSEDKWKKLVPEHLARHLIVKGRENSKLPRLLMVITLSLMVFAVSGPTWSEVDRGEVESDYPLIIALDLSRSMLAADIDPNRLERAKAKVIDLLDERPGVQAALVGFAGTAHTVLHFTNDYNTTKYMLEHVSPDVMPVKGTSFEQLFILADSLFKPMDKPGTLLILTDNLPPESINISQDFTERTQNKIEYLVVATPSGAPIPAGRNSFLKDKNGVTVIPTLNTSSISSYAGINNTNVNMITLDGSDIRKILRTITTDIDFAEKADEENKEWEDYGYWFMFPAVLIMLFWFRKGWVVSWVFLIFTIPWYGCSSQTESKQDEPGFEFIDLWFTKEQQAQRLFDNSEYLEAAEKFEDLYWKGVSYYKAKEFQLAAQAFYQLNTPQGYYNLGMCMAELENWNESVFAFEEALKMYPDFEEAKHNLAEVKKLIPPERKIELVTPQSFEDKFLSRSEELDQESDEEGDREEKEGGEQSVQEQIAQQLQQGNKQVTFPDDSQPQQQQEQKDMLLKQMSADPAVFLKRKFSAQFRKIKNNFTAPEQKW